MTNAKKPDILTEDQIREAMPPGLRRGISPLTVMKVNNVVRDPEEWERFKENFLSYSYVLQQGKFKLDQYINAVRYVGFRAMDLGITESHRRTFPDKHLKWAANGVAEKDIASYTTAYNKSKLVTLIMEQMLVPTHILNASIFQKAINTQAAIMLDDSVSAKVRSDAANSLLTHLKAPEVKKLEVDVAVADVSVQDEYRNTFRQLVQMQKDALASGADVKQIANVPIAMKDKEGAIEV